VAIVFKELQKVVSHSQQQQKEKTRKELFQRLQGKPKEKSCFKATTIQQTKLFYTICIWGSITA
jgi:hypothetical protein